MYIVHIDMSCLSCVCVFILSRLDSICCFVIFIIYLADRNDNDDGEFHACVIIKTNLYTYTYVLIANTQTQ